ncbi:MAG: methyltransferase domain-containing protein [Cyanobacteria bacterium P01_F01_bin.42]
MPTSNPTPDSAPDPDNELRLESDWDNLFLQQSWPKPFVFDESVVQVFDDMVSRSIPFYREVMLSATQWTLNYVQPQTAIVDVGCSTGTFLELVGRLLDHPAKLIGLDTSEPMLKQAAVKLTAVEKKHSVQLVQTSADAHEFANCSVVVMNYTLQFLPVKQRRSLLKNIYRGLEPGGLLFLTDKVISPWPQLQETITQHYERFKAKNGYAQREIERKKEALENVLIPLTEAQLRDMLTSSGFRQIDSLIKRHNFTTFIALKE